MLRSRAQEHSTLVDELSGHGTPSAFGNYRVLHQIGSGVLGPVFRSFDPQRDRIVAVKAFKLDLLPEHVARLAAALRRLVAAGMNHPNHVTLLDAGLEGTTPFLVSEYVSGETLDIARRQIASAPSAALPWLRQIASAVDEAHRGGWFHGALHPRDVMIAGRTGEARMTGFGIAGALESVGARPPIRRPYTAPERTSGDPWDARADVYSLAAIAHELLTGRRPAGPGEQDGSLAGGLSPEQRVAIRKVLATGLAERPELRFESASALVQALETAVTGGQPELPLVPAVPALPIQPPVEQAAEPAPLPEAEPEPEYAVAAVSQSDLAPSFSSAAAGQPIEATAENSEPQPIEVVPAAMEPVAIVETSVATPEPAPPAREGSVLFRGSDAFAIHDRPDVWIPPQPERASYPWAAIAAALLAGLVAGAVIGVSFTRGVRPAPVQTETTATAKPGDTAKPSDTEVAVAPEPAQNPPPAPEPPAAIDSRAERVAAPTGQLIVQSAPAGALVTVDGRHRGETPVTVRDLSLGAHTIQIARPGHIPWSERVTLTAATPKRVLSAQLQPGLDTPGQLSGSVYVDSRPRGARVMIDGRFVGTTPFRMPGLGAGRHDLRIEMDGYRPASIPVTVSAAREARVAVTLEPGGIVPGGIGPVR